MDEYTSDFAQAWLQFIYLLFICIIMRHRDKMIPSPDWRKTRVNPWLTHLNSPLDVPSLPRRSRWSGFLLCAVAMLLVIFPMFTFPKKLPPRHKKKKRRKKLSLDDLSSDDDVHKEKSNNKTQTVTSSMGFGKDIKGRRKYTTCGQGYPAGQHLSLNLTALLNAHLYIRRIPPHST